MLELTRQLLSNPDPKDPWVLLVDTLRSARELVALPENDFSWSSWADEKAAVEELDSLLALVDSGVLPDRHKVSVLFAPTGPIQEVSLSNGWADAFVKLAERYDRAERLLWK